MLVALHISLLILAVLGVVLIVFTKNIVHAAYALCLTLIALAGVYVLLGSELIAVVQIMLYAGGVVILLAFGVMMTNRLRGEKVISESRGVLPATLISLAVLVGFIAVFRNISFETIQANLAITDNQIESIGVSFLTNNLVAFELIAFVLLVALVGAAYLAKSATDE